MSEDLTKFAELVGPVGMTEYEGSPDWAKADLLTWALGLPELSDTDLHAETESAIYESALTQRFRGNWNHVDFKVTACYREAKRRHLAAGHTKDCRADTIYGEAYNALAKRLGFGYSEYGCTCKEDEG